MFLIIVDLLQRRAAARRRLNKRHVQLGLNGRVMPSRRRCGGFRPMGTVYGPISTDCNVSAIGPGPT
jgi:hypothetical protein